jgi:hypothetical protein
MALYWSWGFPLAFVLMIVAMFIYEGPPPPSF